LFEAFGFRYIGPVDGHNIEQLVTALKHAKDQDVPVLIHAHTVKGKGYIPAEVDPIKWHGVLPFDPEEGEFLSAKTKPEQKVPSYTEVFADAMIDVTNINPKVIGITAAMAGGTGLDKYEKFHPNN